MTMQNLLQAAIECHQTGRLADAESMYRQILASEPNNPDALQLLGLVAHQLGRNEDAVELIEKGHRAGRPQPFSLNNLAKAYLGLSRPLEAKKCLAKALAMKPDFAEAHNNLGVALEEIGQRKEAEQSYRRAAALQPDYAEAHYNLANLMVERGAAGEAEQHYRKALLIDPDNADAHFDLANLLFNLGRLAESEQAYRSAIALRPGFTEAEFGLGNMLYGVARQAEAQQCYRRVLELKPDFVAARWVSTMNLLSPLYADEAEEAQARNAFAAGLEALCHWFDSGRGNALPDAQDVVGLQQPFYLPYQDYNNRELLTRYGELCCGLMQRLQARPGNISKPGPKPARIRVGIVSAHIRTHAVWHAIIRGWIEHLDRTRFELVVFSLDFRHDDETRFAKAQAAQFERGPRAFGEWVDCIAERKPDVLIYPELGMDGLTTRLASLRLAPVQAVAWGHPETSGLPSVDYYLSAADFEPANAQDNYSERLVSLPQLGCCYTPRPVAGIAPDLAKLGIDPQAPLLVCPGVPYKYSPRHDAVFVEIARQLGRCQFIFFTYRVSELTEKLRLRLSAAFTAAGMDFGAYGVFVPWQPPPAFYGLMQRADVYLDTIGFSGFNGAMQAVECGLPLVSREGRFMRGRFGSGILTRLGMSELVAQSDEDYASLAVRVASDAAYRTELRARMASSRHLLYGDLAPIRAIEALFADAVAQPGAPAR
jgi:predicted O-linked N-acetylglucosamine transferase (SPINDLY family)